MQQLRAELDRAREERAAATDPVAKLTLDGVIMALDWAIEGGGHPSIIAAALRSDPLDHDCDGKKGGSQKGKLATRAKRA